MVHDDRVPAVSASSTVPACARSDRPTFQGAWIPWLQVQGAALSAWRDAEAPAVVAGED